MSSSAVKYQLSKRKARYKKIKMLGEKKKKENKKENPLMIPKKKKQRRINTYMS